MNKDKIAIGGMFGEIQDIIDRTLLSCFITRIERYVEKQRNMAIGATYAFCCAILDEGRDVRTEEIPKIHADVIKALDRN